MRTRLLLRLAPLALCTAAASGADPQPDLSGWWRASIRHGNESQFLYLHLLPGERPRATMSIPFARTHESGIGPYRTEAGSLRFPAVGWTLAVGADGRTLTGTLPDGIMPGAPSASFERAAPPAAPAEIEAAGPAPAPLWRVPFGAEIWAGLTPDPQGRLLFVAGDDGRLAALSAADGRTIWSRRLGFPIRATPTLVDGRLYVATDRSLAAIEPRRGTVLWTADLGTPLSGRLPITDPHSNWDHYSSSATVAGRMALVGGRDGCLYAFDAARGARRWRTCVGAMITSTPAVSAGLVYFGAFDGRAYALSLADGSERWRYDTHGPIPRDAVVAGGNVLFGSRSYDLVALDRNRGRPAWSCYFWFSWVDSPPVTRGNIVYVGSSDALLVRALDAAAGRPLWSSYVPGWSWARVAVGVNHIYAATVGSTSYLAPRGAALAALDRRTGALRWLYRMPPPGGPAPYGFAAAPAIGGGRLFAADLAGNVYAFPEAAPRRHDAAANRPGG